MFELKNDEKPYVLYQTGKVEFPGYAQYQEQAREVAEYISGLEVTEDNVKEVKADLAAARKITEELTSRKAQIKKVILADYAVFDEQVKDLTQIIRQADQELRGKVRMLEEKERAKKKEEIHQIFTKRIGLYQIGELLPQAFDRWWHEDLANKSKSMKAVEADMVSWLEGTEKDIGTLQGMDAEYLVEYLDSLDLAGAIARVNARKARRETVETVSVPVEQSACFRVTGEKDIALTEMLLKKNHINYRKEA